MAVSEVLENRLVAHLACVLAQYKMAIVTTISSSKSKAPYFSCRSGEAALMPKRLLTSQRLWSIWLFTFGITNCVYRFISYQQNRKPIRLCSGRLSELFSCLLLALMR
jgi:hypothetical protein